MTCVVIESRCATISWREYCVVISNGGKEMKEDGDVVRRFL